MRLIGLAVVLAINLLASLLVEAQPAGRQVKIGVLCAGLCPFHGPAATARPLIIALERVGLVQGRTLAWDIGGIVTTEDLIAVESHENPLATSAPAHAPERSGEAWGKCPEKARSRSGHALVASWSCTGCHRQVHRLRQARPVRARVSQDRGVAARGPGAADDRPVRDALSSSKTTQARRRRAFFSPAASGGASTPRSRPRRAL